VIRLSKRLQELLEEFFRAKDGEELLFQGDPESVRKLSLVLRALGQNVTVEMGEKGEATLRCTKRRP
jgi:hypothetical protein